MKTRFGIGVMALGLLACSSAFACSGLQFYEIDASNNFTITRNRATVTVLFSSLGAGSTAVKAARLQAAVQAQFDDRTLLSSLPSNDPDKTINPNSPAIFWSLSDGTPEPNIANATHLTSRSCLAVVTTVGSVVSIRLSTVVNPAGS
jgi:hypothetical protein